MGGRIDDLEKNIGDLMQQAGIEDEAVQPAKKWSLKWILSEKTNNKTNDEDTWIKTDRKTLTISYDSKL